jgi:hypothetical protein
MSGRRLNMKKTVSITALACAIVATARPPLATAQTAMSVPPPPAPVTVVERSTLPNPALLRTGVAVLAVSYLPAAGVAFFSDHKGDANLFIPVAGPWIDLGTRGCSGSTIWTASGPVETSTGYTCGTTGWEQAALITDGIVQGLGALAILGSLMIPERQWAAWARPSPSPHFTLGPTSFGGRAMGAFAAGRF